MRKITLLMVSLILSTVYAYAQWPVNTFNSTNTETKDIEKDASGNIYVLASFRYTTSFTGGPTITLANSGCMGYYVAKYDAGGAFMWVVNSISTSTSIMEAVDMEINAGEIYILSRLNSSAGTPNTIIQSSATSTTVTSPAYSITSEDYYVSGVTVGGVPFLVNQVDMGSTGITNVTLTSIERKSGNDVYLGGSADLFGTQDAFIGEFTAGGLYTATTNHTAFTSGSANVVNDLEKVYSSALGYTVVYCIGTMTGNNPMGSPLTMTAGISDFFVLSFNSTALGAPTAQIKGDASHMAEGNAIDIYEYPGGPIEVYATGNFIDDLNTFGINSGGITNAFMVEINNDPFPPTLNPMWGHNVEPATINAAYGNDVDVDDAGTFVHFGGEFDGDQFEVHALPAPMGPVPGVPGVLNGWQTAFDTPGGGACMYNSSIVNVTAQPNYSLVGVCEESSSGNVYSTGDYFEELEGINSISASYAPIVHPNPGITENYITRFDFSAGGGALAYYKQQTETSTDNALTTNTTKASVYPNPATDNVQVTLDSSAEGMWNVKVYNMLGALVYASSDLSHNQTYLTLDLDEMPAGVYLLRVEQNDFVSTQQLVVQ